MPDEGEQEAPIPSQDDSGGSGSEPKQADLVPPLRRIRHGILYAFYGSVALGWLVLTPHGFPLTHPRFWVNDILPVVVLLLMAAGLVALFRKRDRLPRTIMMASFCLWAAGVLVGWAVFPASVGLTGVVLCMAVLAQRRPAHDCYVRQSPGAASDGSRGPHTVQLSRTPGDRDGALRPAVQVPYTVA